MLKGSLQPVFESEADIATNFDIGHHAFKRRRLPLRAAFVLTLAASAPATAAPLDEPVVGPKALCFNYSTFSLLEGERVADLSGGPEAMLLTIDGPTGSYQVGESGIFARAKSAKRLVFQRGKTRIYRVSGRRPLYAAYGPTNFSDGENRLVIWLSGSALTGTTSDSTIYRRIDVRDTDKAKCEHIFTYSWGF